MRSTAILIPARYASTRFPGKPTVLLDNMPMIQRVYEACLETNLEVCLLTDDTRVSRCIGNNRNYILDATDYKNGTERCAGAIDNERLRYFDQYINVQGDMPDVTVDMILAVKDLLDRGADVATVYTDLDELGSLDLNTVKMIKGTENAQWFGRGFAHYGYRHLGVYGYKREALKMYPILKKTKEEEIEDLEQLRWLKNGWKIDVSHVQFNGIEINTPQDVERWHQIRHSQ